jgi:acyl-CoA synthetase (NDP forming)/GNAT superfamily N-acetyltransferase
MRTHILPQIYQDSADSGRLILRDGSTALIRPSNPTDREALREFFHQLSPVSKRRRFFSIADPPDTLIERLCDSSRPAQQLTLIVSRILGGTRAIIATGSYVARDDATAEVAFTVHDEFQGRGLGGLLLERLALLAARHGFVRFWALTRVENELMLETFRRSGFPLHTKVEDECVEIDFSVTPSEDSVSRSEARDRIFTTASLLPLFKPRSVAVVGASTDAASIGFRILEALIQGGFPGPIYAVNSRATRVASRPALTSVRKIPQGTDLAVVAIPRDGVLAAVDDCAAVGVRALVVVTAGFAETGTEGRALQEELLARARGLGLRVVGPNSMGVINADPLVRLNASVSPTLPPSGGVAMMSQSAALGLAMLALARGRGLGVSTFISVGNKTDISGNDLLQYWQGDEATRAILLYLQSFGNPRRFARIARRTSQSKPIVVVKAGRATDPEASRTRVGGFAPGDATVNALFRQTGVIRAETLDEMFDLAAALDRQPLPAGRRVAIVSDGGGPGILCADACRAAGLLVPSLSDTTMKRLTAFLSPSATIGNPLELPFSPSAEPYAMAVETLLDADEVDALIAIHTPFDTDCSAAALGAIRRGTTAAREAGGAGKPVLACLVANENGDTALALSGETIPAYAFPESAARVLGKVAAYAEWRAGPHGVILDFDDIDPASARRTCRNAIEQRGPDLLSAGEVRTVLDAMRLPLPAVGMDPATGMERAAEPNASPPPGQPTPGRGVAVKVNMLEDPLFGPLISFGLAGADGEIVTDVSVRVTPLTDRAANAMVREIRGYPLLEGYPGHPPADIEAVCNVLQLVSRLVEEVPEIAELSLNPVLVGPPGEGCRIVNSRIRVAATPTG